MNELVKIKKKCVEFDAFSEEVKNLLMYHCWARCEWEVIISAWASGEAEKKIDVYGQILMNWDNFIKYVWDNRKLIKKVEVR